ncbi:MAG: putative Ig domain-containing protein, partial [Proteobacteria bacterium]|nr:putative Ig domain-containing protein [Pseudomonadota bacterium]
MKASSCRFSHHFAANLYRAFKPNTVLASVASVALVALTACGGSAAVPASVAQAFAPVITSPAPQMLVAGQTVNLAVVFGNTGGPPTSCRVDTSDDKPSLPAGLVLATALATGTLTCQITGTPTGPTDGSVDVTIVATNALGSSSAIVRITIAPTTTTTDPAPAMTDAQARILIAGELASPAIVFTNTGGDAASCAVDTSSGKPDLPASLSVATATVAGKVTCQITGTPAAATDAATYSVTATNAAGSSTASVMITVNSPAPVFAAPALADAAARTLLAGEEVSPAIVFSNIGADADTCHVDTTSADKPDLPAGLTIGTVTDAVSGKVSCQITGTPISATAGAVTVSIVAANSAEESSSASVDITVSQAPSLVRAGAQTFIVDQLVSPAIPLTNTGGDAATCVIDTGASQSTPPPGISAQIVTVNGKATCEITGTPTEASAGAVVVTVIAENELGSSTATMAITVIVRPEEAVDAPVLADAMDSTLIAGVPVSPAIDFTNTGGDVNTCRVDISENKPDLPAGLTVGTATDAVSGKVSCQITGTPFDATTGTVVVSIVAANTAETTASATVSFTVNAPPALVKAGAQTLVSDRVVSPAIVFTNTGGDATTCRVDTSENKPDLPAGLSTTTVTVRGKATCQITGTPTGSSDGAVTITIMAENEQGSAVALIDLTVIAPPPIVVAPALQAATAVTLVSGQTFTPAIVFANTGGDVTTCLVDTSDDKPDLPASLLLTAATDAASGKITCQITGTPDAAAAAADYTITAVNTAGLSTAQVMITIIDAAIATVAPALTDITAPVILVVGEEISAAIIYTNTADDAASCSVDTSEGKPDLPMGLSATSVSDTASGKVTCQITGTPAIATATATYSVTATNAVGTATATVMITVNDPAPVVIAPALTDATAVTLLTGQAFTPAIVFANTGGDVTSCAVDTANSQPDLPASLSLATATDASTGKVTCQITGTPDAATATAAYTITATNTAGTSTAAVMITVIDAPTPTIAPMLANAPARTLVVGELLSPAIVFSNTGDNATTCTIDTSGGNPDLPASLSVSSVTDTSTGKVTCQITGTPDATTTATYTVTATNSIGSFSATVIITVNDPPAIIAPVLEDIATPITVITGTGISSTIVFANTGGDATSCTVDTSGSNADLPSGLSVATVTVAGKVTCQITGTPDTATTTALYTITATNTAGASSATVMITINDPAAVVLAPALANIAAPVTTFTGTAISPAIIYTNAGDDVTSCTVDTSGSNADLPTGLSVAVVIVNGKATCQITGTPDTATATALYTITATNTAGASSATVMITINDPAAVVL